MTWDSGQRNHWWHTLKQFEHGRPGLSELSPVLLSDHALHQRNWKTYSVLETSQTQSVSATYRWFTFPLPANEEWKPRQDLTNKILTCTSRMNWPTFFSYYPYSYIAGIVWGTIAPWFCLWETLVVVLMNDGSTSRGYSVVGNSGLTKFQNYSYLLRAFSAPKIHSQRASGQCIDPLRLSPGIRLLSRTRFKLT